MGALMLDRDAFMVVSDILTVRSFYKEVNQIVYAAILRLFQKGHPIDILTVTEEVRAGGQINQVDGGLYIVDLAQRVASAANIEYHARIVQQKAIQRHMISLCTRTIRDAYEETTDVFQMMDTHESEVMQVRSGKANGTKRIADLTAQVLSSVESAMKSREAGGTIGVTSGLKELNAETGGFRNSDLTVIGARPGMGKSALLNTIALAASKEGKSVGIFSLEMAATQFVARMVSAESNTNSRHMGSGNLNDYDLKRMLPSIEQINQLSIHIDDTPSLNILELRAKARRMKMMHGISILMIDYLQLMSPTDRSGNREQQVAEISRGLKQLAKELDIPVIALAQLSRAVETRGGSKRPQLSDLRESGAVEQDADNVFFIYRPEYYGIMEDENGQSLAGVAEIIIAKNRHGRAGNIYARTKYIPEFTIFRDDETPPSTQFPATAPTYTNQTVPRLAEEDIPF